MKTKLEKFLKKKFPYKCIAPPYANQNKINNQKKKKIYLQLAMLFSKVKLQKSSKGFYQIKSKLIKIAPPKLALLFLK